jgi:hypothetical protein
MSFFSKVQSRNIPQNAGKRGEFISKPGRYLVSINKNVFKKKRDTKQPITITELWVDEVLGGGVHITGDESTPHPKGSKLSFYNELTLVAGATMESPEFTDRGERALNRVCALVAAVAGVTQDNVNQAAMDAFYEADGAGRR